MELFEIINNFIDKKFKIWHTVFTQTKYGVCIKKTRYIEFYGIIRSQTLQEYVQNEYVDQVNHPQRLLRERQLWWIHQTTKSEREIHHVRVFLTRYASWA